MKLSETLSAHFGPALELYQQSVHALPRLRAVFHYTQRRLSRHLTTQNTAFGSQTARTEKIWATQNGPRKKRTKYRTCVIGKLMKQKQKQYELFYEINRNESRTGL